MGDSLWSLLLLLPKPMMLLKPLLLPWSSVMLAFPTLACPTLDCPTPWLPPWLGARTMRVPWFLAMEVHTTTPTSCLVLLLQPLQKKLRQMRLWLPRERLSPPQRQTQRLTPGISTVGMVVITWGMLTLMPPPTPMLHTTTLTYMQLGAAGTTRALLSPATLDSA